MKQKLIIFLIVSLVFTSCKQPLTVTFYNKTGYDVDSLFIDHFYVGSIKKDAVLCIDTCVFLELQDGRPLSHGLVDKVWLKRSSRCGNTDSSLKDGHHEFDLYLFKRNMIDFTETCLETSRHK